MQYAKPISPSKKVTKRKEIIDSLITYHRLPSYFIGDVTTVILSWVYGLGIPLFSVGIALIVKIQLSTFIGENTLFLLFFIPIVISTLSAGLYSGIIATLLGAGAAGYFLIGPLIRNTLPLRETLTLLIYCLEGFVISYFLELQRRIQLSVGDVEERFRLLLQNTVDYAILFLDPFGTIVRWNTGAQKMFGYKENEIVGNHFSVLFTAEDREKGLPEREYRTALRRNRSTDENYLIKKDESIFWGSGLTTPLWDKNDNIRGFVKIIRDTTQFREIEQQREDFISVASHELKTPVASMQIYTQLLQKYYANNRPEKKEPIEYLSRIADQLKQLNELMTTLLDISRIQQGRIVLQKDETDMTKLVDNVIENIQATQSHHSITRTGIIKGKILVDRRRIEEVLTNLLTNAIKYSPQATRVSVKLQSTRKLIRISVRDYGIGIPKNKIQRVFERFYRAESGTSQAPGMGLGLYISHQIAKAHKGDLQVQSKVGKGSTFSLTLPK